MASNTNPAIIAPDPSLKTLTECTFKYIANHPLVINPPIYHPITEEQVLINNYRLWDGIVVTSGLVCSIYADFPREAAIFEPYDLGSSGVDKATFFIRVKYSYNQVVLGNIQDDENLIEVPAWSEYGLGEMLLTSNLKNSVTLEINPGIEIIQDYLQLTKYIIDDASHQKDFPIPITSMQMISQSVKTRRWEENDTIFFQEGNALIRFEAYISRGWRDKLDPHYLSQINIKTTIN